jgi:hypothetical protein
MCSEGVCPLVTGECRPTASSSLLLQLPLILHVIIRSHNRFYLNIPQEFMLDDLITAMLIEVCSSDLVQI